MPSAPSPRDVMNLEHSREFIQAVFESELHAKRVLSLANGVAGVLSAAILSLHAIGQAYARLAGIEPRSGVKQVDRLVSNEGIQLAQVLRLWVAFVVGASQRVVIALDWTDFDNDDHTTLAAYMVTHHGRALPLAWKTVRKSELKDRRTGIELDFVSQLHEWLPSDVDVILLADRGFGYVELYEMLKLLGWDYVIRFKQNINIQPADEPMKPAAEFLQRTGRARKLQNVAVTEQRITVAAVVLVKAARMKEAWCLATSLSSEAASRIVKLYGKRFSIEETFRDTKDMHFGWGLRATHIHNANRRDRLLLLVAAAHALLTLLGQAAEQAGLDRYLKVNTVKRRTHSLYRQGRYWYSCIPTMREEWLRRLMTAFDSIVSENAFFSEVFGQV